MLALAKQRYSNRTDWAAAEMWFRNIVLKGPMVFLPLRTDHAFLVGMITVVPWRPAEWEAIMMWLCSEDGFMWEALALLREGAAWAKRRKCVEFRISSETTFDIAPLAKRIGAKELRPQWGLRFDE
jgi:hypothetical protein